MSIDVKSAPALNPHAQTVRNYARRILGKDNQEFFRTLNNVAESLEKSQEGFSNVNASLNQIKDITDAVPNLQSVPVSDMPPPDLSVLTYVKADGKWEPKALPAPPTVDSNTAVFAGLGLDYTLTTSYADTGLFITANKSGTWLVLATVRFNWTGGTDARFHAQLVFNSSAQAGDIYTNALEESSHTSWWVVDTVSPGDLFKIQAYKEVGTGSSKVMSQNTRLGAIFLHG